MHVMLTFLPSLATSTNLDLIAFNDLVWFGMAQGSALRAVHHHPYGTMHCSRRSWLAQESSVRHECCFGSSKIGLLRFGMLRSLWLSGLQYSSGMQQLLHSSSLPQLLVLSGKLLLLQDPQWTRLQRSRRWSLHLAMQSQLHWYSSWHCRASNSRSHSLCWEDMDAGSSNCLVDDQQVLWFHW